MQNQIEMIGEEEILPISLLQDSKNMIHLFYSQEWDVDYSLYTDGVVSHLDTWIDKYPGKQDAFLHNCGTVKRFEFKITDAHIVLIKKKYGESSITNLYIDHENLFKIARCHVYQVSINEHENIMIKKLEKFL